MFLKINKILLNLFFIGSLSISQISFAQASCNHCDHLRDECFTAKSYGGGSSGKWLDNITPKRGWECTKAADLGNVDAQRVIGIYYCDGRHGFSVDKKKSHSYFLRAAKQGDKDGQYNSGVLFSEGYTGQAPDKEKALKLYLEAAEQGHMNAQHNAGILFLRREGTEAPNKGKALALFQEASKQGHPKSKSDEALLTSQEFEGHPSDKKKAIEIYESIEETSEYYAPALSNIGAFYATGFDDQKPDLEKALKYFLESGSKEYTGGFLNAGMIYIMISKPDTALRYFIIAAERGNALAQFNYALLLKKKHLRDFNKENLDEIQEYFYKAAEQGFVSAMVNLGIFYLELMPEYDNISKALFWFEKAQNLGSDVAQRYLKHTQKLLEEKSEIEEEKGHIQLNEILEEAEKPFEEAQIESFTEAPHAPKTRTTFSFKRSEKNIKAIREKNRALGRLRKQYNSPENHSRPSLSSKNQEILDKINRSNQKVLTHNKLALLFNDPFFRNEVLIEKTKNGIKIVAHNKETNQHATIGTHKSHSDKQKKAFLKDIKNKILALFNF